MTSTEQINNLITSCTELKSYFETARDRIESAIDTMYDTVLFYVDGDVGDDANDGSVSHPFKNFGKAMSMARNGGKTTIRLRQGQSYNMDGANDDFNFTDNTVVEVARWDSDWSDVDSHPEIHIECDVSSGLNSVKRMVYAYAPFSFIARGVRLVCDTPIDTGLGWLAFRRNFIRVGNNIAGTTIDVRFYRSHLTIPADAAHFAGPNYRETILLGLEFCTITGDGALICDVSKGCAIVSVGNLTSEGTTKLLDGGTVGQNVLTNSPGVTV
ncbi:hypothetical protein DL1_03330 [Thioclava dalianensis]|uniref:DUF1565 domain-containing protein n=1 Tax=Thioclava dalianensis TaxID=1185766 RepID=A0A074U4T3_9RHOB|nr:hypothetical protein [Thioclava dalianensis]KEP69657.1 hypothetical protein DL1_03330 [Thioclava dalianensis]SFN16280.1 hypothetical protein SAMN05216224_102728 [Thioclava dalianensis]